jgi:hypothetical protein
MEPEMHKFFLLWKKPGETDVSRSNIQAPDAMNALEQVGWPTTRVFTLYQYLSIPQIDALLAANPAGEILSFEAWEEKYGPADSDEFLWVEVKTDTHMGPRHPTTNGRYTIRVCARTGHVRWPSVGEWYDNWITPKSAQAA